MKRHPRIRSNESSYTSPNVSAVALHNVSECIDLNAKVSQKSECLGFLFFVHPLNINEEWESS